MDFILLGNAWLRNFSGSIWAYRALGWGGYWAWDPVENAALVPWLILCAYIHNKDKISRIKCVIPFIAACVGTFLVRSGLLQDQSSHAYTDGNILITVILVSFLVVISGFLVLLKLKNRRGEASIHFGMLKDKKQIFIYIIYLYAFLIASGTLLPLIFGIVVSTGYFTIISIAFAVSYCVMLLLRDLEMLKKRSLFMLIISTLGAIGIALLTDCFNLEMIILMWICLMPLSLWICSGFKTQNLKYYLVHIGFLLLIIGAVASSGFGKETYILADQASPFVNIGNSNYLLSDLLNRNTTFMQSFWGDTILQTSNSVVSNGFYVIPCFSKPLIVLFWAGGFITIFEPYLFVGIRSVIKKLQSRRGCNTTTLNT